MADLNIPNLNTKSDKYIFKKKLNFRRKSKRRLFTESFFLFILSLLLVYINYLIPNKNILLQELPITFKKSKFGLNKKDKFFNFFIPPFIAICSLIVFSYSFIYFYSPLENIEKEEQINPE